MCALISLQGESVGKGHSHNDARTPRLQGIEWLRLVAAFGIVAYHDNVPGRDLAYSGLMVFLILSTFVDLHFNWERKRPLPRLASAILLPWLFWCVVYAAVNEAAGRPVFREIGFLRGVLFGPSYHLWFLPFIFLVLAVVQQAKNRVSPIFLFYISIISALALLLTAANWRPASFEWGDPWAQWAHSAAGIFLGIAVGLATRVRMGVAVIVATVVIMVANALLHPVEGVSLPYAIGMSAVVIVAWVPLGSRQPSFDVQPVSRCMMGVYLVHPLFLSVTRLIFGPGNYAGSTVAFGLGLATVLLSLWLVPKSAWVFGVR